MTIHLQHGAVDVPDGAERNASFELHHCFTDGNAYDSERIALHFNAICGIKASPSYAFAYQRWKKSLTSGGATLFEARVNIRLLIGMAQPSLWETNLYLNPIYGTPWIPGSSSKGALRHYIERYLIAAEGDAAALGQGYLSREVFNYLFGTTESAGLVILHDAWWVPESAPAASGWHLGPDYPLVREITTPHHPDFLDQHGAVEATPFDSPRPIPQLAAHGKFLIALAPRLQAHKFWAAYAAEYVKHALAIDGVGARTPEYGQMTEAPAAQ